MKALILGIVVVIAAVLAVLPACLGWGDDVLAFLRGALPVIVVLIGAILIFVGIADNKDRVKVKRKARKKNGNGSE